MKNYWPEIGVAVLFLGGSALGVLHFVQSALQAACTPGKLEARYFANAHFVNHSQFSKIEGGGYVEATFGDTARKFGGVRFESTQAPQFRDEMKALSKSDVILYARAAASRFSNDAVVLADANTVGSEFREPNDSSGIPGAHYVLLSNAPARTYFFAINSFAPSFDTQSLAVPR